MTKNIKKKNWKKQSPEADPSIHSNLTCDKGSIRHQQERGRWFSEWCQKTDSFAGIVREGERASYQTLKNSKCINLGIELTLSMALRLCLLQMWVNFCQHKDKLAPVP